MTDIGRKLRASTSAFCRDTSGVILPYVTAMLVVIVGTSVLALDGARYMSLQTQLQNGADALALAGAAELDQKPDSITRATNAINNLVSNSTLYKNLGASGSPPNVQVSSIRFLSSLPASDNTNIAAANVTTIATQAHFVEVTVTPVALTTILPATFFGGTNTTTAGARAVAGFPNEVVCDFPPIFMCNPWETAGMTDDAATQALDAAFANPAQLRKQFRLDQNKTGPGQFGFLIPPDGCTGANCLGDWISRTSPKACYSKASVDLNTGMKTSLNDAFNVRFDIQKGSYTLGPNYAPDVNVRKGYVQKKNDSNWCNAMPALNSGWSYTSWSYNNNADGKCNANKASAPAPQAPISFPKDSSFFSGGTNVQGNGNWNCLSYWWNAHTSAPPAGCTATNPSISRYQVYQYEIGSDPTNPSSLVGESSFYKASACTSPETGRPACAAGQGVPNRRGFVVAVINCLAQAPKMTGGSTANNIPVARFGKYFMTQPVGNELSPYQNHVFGEFTGVATQNDGIRILDQVQLYR